MNKIILVGRLTRDPELRYTPNGAAVCTFTIAVDRPFNSQSGEKEADFIETVTWNKTAENVHKYMKKGRQIAVEGRLQIRSYEDKDGNRRWRTEVIANQVEFLGGGNNNGNGDNQNQYGSNNGNFGNQNNNQQQSNNNQQFNNGQQSNQQNNGMGTFDPLNFGTEISFSDSDLPF